MKHLYKYNERLTEDIPEKKYLIQLCSANSRGVRRNSPLQTKRQAETYWSMSVIINTLEISNRHRLRNNEELTRLVAGYSDIKYFGRDIEGLIGDTRFRFKLNTNRNCSIYTREINLLLSNFKSKLNIDQKLEFFEIIPEFGYLIIRNSYIYKVIDESELNSSVDDIITIIHSSSDHII